MEVPGTVVQESYCPDTWWQSLGTGPKKSWDSAVLGRSWDSALLGRSWDSAVLGQSWDGAVLGQYSLGTVLGQCGLGTVRCWDSGLGTVVLGQWY